MQNLLLAQIQTQNSALYRLLNMKVATGQQPRWKLKPKLAVTRKFRRFHKSKKNIGCDTLDQVANLIDQSGLIKVKKCGIPGD